MNGCLSSLKVSSQANLDYIYNYEIWKNGSLIATGSVEDKDVYSLAGGYAKAGMLDRFIYWRSGSMRGIEFDVGQILEENW